MNTKRRSFTRFLSCLLALCLLLSIIPATAESPATPTDLGPVTEEVQESGEPEVSGEPEAAGEGEEAKTTGDPGDPDGASGEDGLPSAEEAEEADPVEEDPDETNPVEADPDEADPAETEQRYQHIAACKKLLPAPTDDKSQFGSAAQKALCADVMRQAIHVKHAPQGKPLPRVDADTLFLGVAARAETLASDDIPLDAATVCAQVFGAKRVSLEEQLPTGAGTAVVFLNKHPNLQKAIDAACALAAAGTQVIAVDMNVPLYLEGLPDTVWQVEAWQYDQFCLDLLIEKLRG